MGYSEKYYNRKVNKKAKSKKTISSLAKIIRMG